MQAALFASFLTLSLTGFSLVVAHDGEFKERCGDCWCINDPQGEGVACPDHGVGIADSFPPEVYEPFEKFTLISDPILLETESGSRDCFPFADTVQPLDDYPLSNNPPCAIPESPSDTAVCAFKFTTDSVQSDEECCNREYGLVSYNSVEEAEADGAQVTHHGVCGVCSSAADFAVHMKNTATVDEHLTLCAASYSLSTDDNRFERLVACHQEVSDRVSLGFTDECALLWAHYGATNADICLTPCFTGFSAGQIAFNGDPPQCALEECLACSASNFQEAFNKLSGRTIAKSGLTETIARPCTDFAAVIHESCGDFTCVGSTPPPSSSRPALSSHAVFVTLLASALVVSVGSMWY